MDFLLLFNEEISMHSELRLSPLCLCLAAVLSDLKKLPSVLLGFGSYRYVVLLHRSSDIPTVLLGFISDSYGVFLQWGPDLPTVLLDFISDSFGARLQRRAQCQMDW